MSFPVNKPIFRPCQLTPEQARTEFNELAPFFENHPPELRFLSTGVANFDLALGGAGLPSSMVTHWRATHDFAADVLLLELCRAACARGERVYLIDASNRFGAAILRAAGLDAFEARGLFKRLQLTTMSDVALLVDAWRRGEAGGVPSLLVVDSLVAVVETNFVKGQNSEHRISNSRRQGQMFYRLLVKLSEFARACGAGLIVAELPIKRNLHSHRAANGRRNTSLQCTALGTLNNFARVELVLQTSSMETGIVQVHVMPNRFVREGAISLVDVHAKSNAKL